MCKKTNEGITLLVLILIIVVLLIISGVSLGIILDNDFFKKAEEIANNAHQGLEERENQENQITNSWWSSPGKPVTTYD